MSGGEGENGGLKLMRSNICKRDITGFFFFKWSTFPAVFVVTKKGILSMMLFLMLTKWF